MVRAEIKYMRYTVSMRGKAKRDGNVLESEDSVLRIWNIYVRSYVSMCGQNIV